MSCMCESSEDSQTRISSRRWTVGTWAYIFLVSWDFDFSYSSVGSVPTSSIRRLDWYQYLHPAAPVFLRRKFLVGWKPVGRLMVHPTCRLFLTRLPTQIIVLYQNIACKRDVTCHQRCYRVDLVYALSRYQTQPRSLSVGRVYPLAS